MPVDFLLNISWKEKSAAKNAVKEVVVKIIIVELCPNNFISFVLVNLILIT